MSSRIRNLSRLVLALGAVVLVYSFAVRPWMLSWGATAEERAAPLPGDAIVPAATQGSTRSIGIAAPAERVWPWIAQLGQDRAGFYSFELLEDLVGGRMPRATTLQPELQSWRPGDHLWMYPAEKLEGTGSAPLLAAEPGRALAFGTWYPTSPHTRPPDGSWAFVVDPVSGSTSRLVIRSRGAEPPSLATAMFDRAVFEPMHFVMERRMMEGVRRLAEGRNPPHSRFEDALHVLVWIALLAAMGWGIVATLRRERWQAPLAATIGAALGFELATLGQPHLLIGLLLVALPFALLLSDRRRPAVEGSAAGA